MLNSIPFVVVKEYFFKNQASQVDDFIRKIAGTLKAARDKLADIAKTKSEGGGDTIEKIKNSGKNIVEAIAK